MTEETKARPVVQEEMIDPKIIIIPPGNRPVKKDEAFKELKASIEKDSLLNPILVLDHTDAEGKSTYTLIAGERRLRACLDLKLESIPVRAFVASDDEVAAIRAVENLHRQNLNPIEEANALKAVADKLGGDLKAAASVVNKPVAHVDRLIALLTLPAKVQAFIGDGQLTAAHGFHLLRVDENHREKLSEWVTTMNWAKRYPSVDELRDEIAQKVERNLKSAPWDLNETIILDPGDAIAKKPRPQKIAHACSMCPRNSGNQGTLFDGAQAGLCTDPHCFSAKEKWFYEEVALKFDKKFDHGHDGHKARPKFLGIAKDNGYQGRGGSVKKHPILPDEVVADAAVKKAMEEWPEAFAWAVLKPGSYSETKKARMVFVALDPSKLPAKYQPKERKEPGTKDWELEQKKTAIITNSRNASITVALDKMFNAKEPKLDHLVGMAFRVGRHTGMLERVLFMMRPDVEWQKEAEAEKAVKKFNRADAMRLLWLVSFQGYSLIEEARGAGLDTKKPIAEGDKLAAEAIKNMLDKMEPKK